MNQLQQAIARYQKRVQSMQELEKALNYERQVHYTLTKEDFGLADGDPANVIGLVQAIAKITQLQKQPTLGVV
jgi:hypothetical protein